MSIHPSITCRLLRHCPQLVNLILYGSISPVKYGIITQALNGLAHLKFLSVDVASLFQMRFVYLPNASVFHHVTHLDLTAHWTSEAVIRGFQFLASLTHLSITWKQARHTTSALRDLLHCPNFQMIMLWRDELETHPAVISDLLKCRLDDPCVILLHRASRWSLRVDGGFWLHAARIIAWRKQNNSEYLRVCVQHQTHLTLQSPPWNALRSWRIYPLCIPTSTTVRSFGSPIMIEGLESVARSSLGESTMIRMVVEKNEPDVLTSVILRVSGYERGMLVLSSG